MLEGEVRTELRRKGCQLVWLDRDGDFEKFVDELRGRWETGDFAYPVVAYRGSFLEVMLQLDEFVDRTDHQAVLIHMPGYNEDTIRSTPVYEHYKAGKRYRKKLATLVEEAAAGKVAPRAIENFSEGKEDEDVTLRAADDWLEEQTREESLLDKLSITELWCRLESSGGEDLPEDEADFDGILEHLQVRVGLTDEWRGFSQFSKGPARESGLSALADELAGWAMAVEYVDDLRRQPVMDELQPLGELPDQIRDICRGLAAFMRETSGYRDTYVRIADELGERLEEEFEAGVVDDLGEIDTFRFEEKRFLRGALEAIGKEQWERALDRTKVRAAGESFWVDRDPKRAHAWKLARAAARLGEVISENPAILAGAQSLPEAVQAYAEGGWEVDRAHRLLEQQRAALLEPKLPEFALLRSHLDGMRRLYREWADDLARQFNDLCEQAGFIPTESLQQRHLFDQVVEPWTYGNEKTAVFMVDALRYEMGAELRDEFTEPGTGVQLEGRLAELPTVTAVGMNALAPVTDSSGELRPLVSGGKIKGFETSVFQVRNRKTRKKMMRHRVEGRTCPLFYVSQILEGTKDLQRAVQEASLVLVHSKGIDEVGEQGYGQLTFETTLRDIRSAVRILREAGVQRFVITSDHGFLLLDSTTRKKTAHGKKTDPNHRWRLFPAVEDDPELVATPLTSLKYADTDEALLMPRDTAIFDTGKMDKTFVHGGNSLQERMIPVLKLEYRREIGGSTADYQIDAQVGESMMDMHCLVLKVSPSQGVLDLGGPQEVELSMRAPEDVSVELCSGRGGAKLRGASAVVPVDETVEVFFKLRAESDRRAGVEVFAPTQSDVVRPTQVDAQFDVIGVGAEGASEAVEEEAESDAAAVPLDAIDDKDVRKVFAHILEYGSIDEQGATKLIGSARKFRRFSMKFEEYVGRLPFVVEIRWSDEKSLKEYVLREGPK